VLSSLSFLTPVRTLARESGLERGAGALRRLFAGELIVLSRALCHFESMPTPPGGRGPRAEQAARLAARTRSPFNTPRLELSWGGDIVGVWSWEDGSTPDLDDATRVIPETLLHPPGEGPVLRACLDGVEGQVWRSGSLIASRWWRAAPTPAEWAAFLRAARTPWDGPPPSVEPLSLAAREPPQPWISLERLKKLGWRDAAAAALLLVAAPAIYFGAQYVTLALEESRLEARVSALEGETAALEAARARAAAAAAELRQYEAVIGGPHPAALLAEFAEQVTAHGAELVAFEVREDRIEAQFSTGEDQQFEPAAIVSALEARPLLAGAAIEPGRRPGEWRVTALVERDGGAA